MLHIPDTRRTGTRLTLPKLRIGAALLAMSAAVAKAFELAYVTPYQGSRRRPSAADDADLQGRDPNW